jgi:hypothetical protein
MNTIDVMKQALSVVRSSQEYNMGLSSFVEVVDDLEQAIKQEQANIQTQITKDILRPVKTYSGGKAWPVEVLPEGHRFTPFNNENLWVGLTDEEIEQEFGGIDEMLRDYVYRIEAKLKEKNSKG